MAAFRRTISTRTGAAPGGATRCVARLDDFFHGFEVTLDVRDGDVVAARATAHRHPWNTCTGALGAVDHLRGPAHTLGQAAVELPRISTCVHVNDLVWLASHQHEHRTYDVEVTPTRARLSRNQAPQLQWPLVRWTIGGDGRLAGLGMSDSRWADRLDAIDADDDLREAVKVLRRGVLVAIGYYTLDWDRITRGTDVPQEIMRDTCYTFATERVADAVCLAEVPDRRAHPRHP